MRKPCVILAAVLAATLASSARAGELWPAIPPESGTAPRIGPVWLDYRCSAGQELMESIPLKFAEMNQLVTEQK